MLRYVGDFEDDSRHGAGTLTVVDTPVALSGTWDNGAFNGSALTSAMIDVVEQADDVTPKLIVALAPAVALLRARADDALQGALAATASAVDRLRIAKPSPTMVMLMPLMVTGIIIVVIALAEVHAHVYGKVALVGGEHPAPPALPLAQPQRRDHFTAALKMHIAISRDVLLEETLSMQACLRGLVETNASSDAAPGLVEGQDGAEPHVFNGVYESLDGMVASCLFFFFFPLSDESCLSHIRRPLNRALASRVSVRARSGSGIRST